MAVFVDHPSVWVKYPEDKRWDVLPRLPPHIKGFWLDDEILHLLFWFWRSIVHSPWNVSYE